MSEITPKEGEEVLMHLRKSILVMQKQMLIFGLSVIVALILLVFLYQYPVANIVAITLLLVSLAYVFYYFLIWFYDVHIITNIRVITHAKKNLFQYDFAEFDYADVSDVSYSVKGVLATIFQYGTVKVTLHGEQARELDFIATPGIVQETLKNLVDVTNNKKYH